MALAFLLVSLNATKKGVPTPKQERTSRIGLPRPLQMMLGSDSGSERITLEGTRTFAVSPSAANLVDMISLTLLLLFGRTILVLNRQCRLFGPVHSGKELFISQVSSDKCALKAHLLKCFLTVNFPALIHFLFSSSFFGKYGKWQTAAGNG